MFGNMRHLCSGIARIRYFNTSPITKLKYTPKENPGVNRRLKVISEDEPDIDKAEIDYDSFEDLEQDFMEADHMHDEIIDEMYNISKKQQFKITEQRHFRPPKEPIMLTWSEKEQIRFLHQSDSEKWTVEKLSESFPASPTIIKKILRAKWKSSNAERLKAHDHRVSENWKSFHNGQLEIHDPRLQAHLTKFIDRKDGVRSISDKEAEKITEVILPKPKRTEFLSIITSFKPESVSNVKELQQGVVPDDPPKLHQRGSRNNLSSLECPQVNYTLEQYTIRLEEEVNKMTDSPQDVNAIINKKKTQQENRLTETYVAPSESFKPNAEVIQKRMKSRLELTDPDNLPNRIKIPKEAWKQGLLYKVNDSFYNDQGYFLYRVPGLKS